MKTTFLPKEQVVRKWLLVDAERQPLGRLANRLAAILRGKNTAKYTPFTDSGDYLVIINASKVSLSGRKMRQKMYWRHSGYPGGLKETAARDMKPAEIVRKAVLGMLPGNKLRSKQMARLKIFEGPEHTFSAQKPEAVNI